MKMSRVIYEMDKHTQHILVHTGQNSDYELNQIFFDDLEIRKPDYFLDANCSHTINTIAKILQEADKLLEKEQPDAVMIYGDTNSCLAIIAAKKRQIPIFHMEAGNRCFDQRVPEESNRKVVDHLSDINIVLSEHARGYLLAEGFPANRIIKSGSHMQEVLDYYMPKINDSTILSSLQLTPQKYFLVSAHREENVDSAQNINDLLETLNCIATTYHMPIVVSTHPRTKMRLEKCETSHLDSRIQFLKPFGFTDYIKLQLHAKCILSDSGTITEEASLLSLPAITIRNAHERPEGMDVGTLIMSGLKSQNVLEAINVICAQHSHEKEHRKRVPDYDYGIVSKKILTIILSYIPFVNRVVWSKNV
ncbi:MAG TPA: UDP-N-acetylglucosamine 2-epimerase (non-hydrolyzing) [Candidatus Berkiella sp.]|nr:UDP-N-acetylglucosamine 2-epimerase (non-hydrolyzing) [Candidatus Berkiella sp.]